MGYNKWIMNTKQRGFTLIELLVVISIVSLLSSIVIASVKSARDKGNITAGKVFATHNRSAFFDETLVNFEYDTGTAVNTGFGRGTVTVGGGATFPADTDLKNKGNSVRIDTAAHQYILFTDNALYNDVGAAVTGANFTLSTWFKFAGPTCTSGYCSLMAVGPNSNGASAHLALLNATTMRVRINGGPFHDFTWNSPTSGQWAHYALVVTSTRVAVYVNGKIVYNQPHGSTLPALQTHVAVFGSLASTAYTAAGFYDDSVIYKKALVASEIEHIYAEGLQKRMLADVR